MKKQHLVLISDYIYPHLAPTPRVALEYIELLKEYFEFSIIYMSDRLEDNHSHQWKEYQMYPCCHWRMRMRQYFLQKKGMYSKIGIFCSQAFGAILTLTHFPDHRYWFVHKAFKTLETINKEHHIDVIFAVGNPFSGQLAAKRFKNLHPRVKWVTYTVDPYSAYKKLFPLWMTHKAAVRKELQCLQTVDIRFMSEELIANRKDLSEKLNFIPLPYMLKMNNCDNGNKIELSQPKSKRIKLVYAGAFYYLIRNPIKMLETIYQLRQKDIDLYIYSDGYCLDIVKSYTKKPHSNIYYHSKISHEELAKVYEEADFLVNIANKTPEFSPSKIFEYIAMRKPIIEFSNNRQDGYLMKYPLSLVLSDKDRDTVDKVDIFCHTKKDMRVSPSEIESLYEKHIQNNIKKLLEESFLSSYN